VMMRRYKDNTHYIKPLLPAARRDSNKLSFQPIVTRYGKIALFLVFGSF
jgi:hypothetical protein